MSTRELSFVQTLIAGKPPTQQQRIIAALQGGKHSTRAELSVAANIPLTSAITARLNELVKAGKIVEGGTTLDSTTMRRVTTYCLPSAPWAVLAPQPDLLTGA